MTENQELRYRLAEAHEVIAMIGEAIGDPAVPPLTVQWLCALCHRRLHKRTA